MDISKQKMADKDDARESLQLDQATLEAITDGVAAKLRQGSVATGSEPGTSKDFPSPPAGCENFEG